jgi:membrane protease YdiL (CAAX protease family)
VPGRGRRRRAAAKQSQKAPSHRLKCLSYAITASLVALALLVSPLCYLLGVLSSGSANAVSTVALELFFPSIVFSYLFFRNQSTGSVISQLGLSRSTITPKNIGIALLLFFAIFLVSVLISLFSTLTNIPLPTNVQQVLGSAPLYFLIFSFLVAPICEEILFRGFLVPRVGIIISALVFAALHVGYLSASEFIAAFIFGLMAGYVFKKTKALYPSILAHMLVNFVTVMSLLYVGMFVHLLQLVVV